LGSWRRTGAVAADGGGSGGGFGVCAGKEEGLGRPLEASKD